MDVIFRFSASVIIIGKVSTCVREEIFLHQTGPFLAPDIIWVVLALLYYDLHKSYISKK